jgi:hypothetical protein
VHARDVIECVHVRDRLREAHTGPKEGRSIDGPREAGPLEDCTIAVADVARVVPVDGKVVHDGAGIVFRVNLDTFPRSERLSGSPRHVPAWPGAI